MGKAGRKKRLRLKEREENDDYEEGGYDDENELWVEDRKGEAVAKSSKRDGSSSAAAAAAAADDGNDDKKKHKKKDKHRHREQEKEEEEEESGGGRKEEKEEKVEQSHHHHHHNNYSNDESREPKVFGWQPDADNLAYMIKVEQIAKQNAFEDDEEREIFVNNVWKEFSLDDTAHVVRLVGHKEGSNAVEKMIPLCGLDKTLTVLTSIAPNVGELAGNPFGSHVLETTFNHLLTLFVDDVKDDVMKQMLKTVDTIFDLLLEDWLELMKSIRGSFSLRAFIRFLAGIPKPIPGDYRPVVPVAVPQEFDTLKDRLLHFHVQSSNAGVPFHILARSKAAAPVLQQLLEISPREANVTNDLCKAILNWPKKQENEKDDDACPSVEYIHQLARCETGSRTLEAALKVLPRALFQPLYNACFRGHLKELSSHPLSNFVVSALLNIASLPAHVSMIADELSPLCTDAIQKWRASGVVQQLAEAAARLGTAQQKVFQAIAAAVSTDKDKSKNLLGQILCLGLHPRPTKIGACIASALFTFDDAAIASLVASVDTCKEQDIIQWSMDGCASRAIEKMFSSRKFPNQSKTKLIQKMANHLVDLAQSPCGSRVVEAAFMFGDVSAKELVAKKLAPSFTLLLGNKYGRIVVNRCKVKEFREKVDWVDREEAKDRHRHKFEEMLGTEETEQQKREKAEEKAKTIGDEKTEKMMKALRGSGDSHQAAAAAAAAEKKRKSITSNEENELEEFTSKERDRQLEEELFGKKERKKARTADDDEEGKEDDKKKKKKKSKDHHHHDEKEDEVMVDDSMKTVMDALAASKGKRKKNKDTPKQPRKFMS